MKNLKTLFVMLMVGAVSVFSSCKKSDDAPANLDHKVVFKAITDPKTAMNTANYTDGSGKTETFTNKEGYSLWASQEFVISSTVKTIDFSAEANALVGDPSFFLNVEIWVDGVKKSEGKTTTVTNKGQLKATATYTF